MLRTLSSFMPVTRTYRNRLRAVLPTAESRQNWAIPAAWQPRANAPTTPSSSRFNSSSLQRIDPEPTPTQLTALTGPWLKTSRARAAVRSAKSAAPVSRTTLRTRPEHLHHRAQPGRGAGDVGIHAAQRSGLKPDHIRLSPRGQSRLLQCD